MPPLTDMLAALAIAAPAGLPDMLTGLSADSRRIAPGMLYAALPGSRVDGRAYIAEAVRRGAAAVLAPAGTTWPEGAPPRPLLLHPEPRQALARLASAHAGPQPGTVVAITGTNGKTSTAEFFRQILTRAGHRAASIGTLGVLPPLPAAEGRGDGSPQTGGLTTMDPIQLAETLATLARAGTTHAALEASSHGLDQFRLDGVQFAAAAFTNLTRDHLDYHGTLAAYRAAKLRLFTELLPKHAPAVASTALDPDSLAALQSTRPDIHLVGEHGTLIRLLQATAHPGGQTLLLEAGGRRHTVDLPLPGRFQADNALLAAGLALSLGIAGALDHLPALTGVRGRMERVTSNAYVDYAHTPDALARLLTALRPHTAGRLIVVYGAGGDRDPGKRPLMGEAVRNHADIGIITDDNPRGEDPAAIRAAIRAAHPEALEVADRAEAIATGLALLRPGDVLAVAGKGHEPGQTIAGITHPFDDAATLRRLAAP